MSKRKRRRRVKLERQRFQLSSLGVIGVDPTSGIVRGVSVATVGEARGHGQYLDRTSLQMIQACAARYSSGVKVKLDHDAGVGDIVGYLRDFRTEGDKLLADLHLLTSSPHRAFVLELAARMPDTFGLSIAFLGYVDEQGGLSFARPTELFSVDLVTEPAANAAGLFCAEVDVEEEVETNETPETPKMTPEQIMQMINQAMAAAIEPFNAKLAALEGRIPAPAAPAAGAPGAPPAAPAKPETEPREMGAPGTDGTVAQGDPRENLGAILDQKLATLKADITTDLFTRLAGSFGVAPGRVGAAQPGTAQPGTSGDPNAGKPVTFSSRLGELATSKHGGDKRKALRELMTTDPAAYQAARDTGELASALN